MLSENLNKYAKYKVLCYSHLKYYKITVFAELGAWIERCRNRGSI